jgi:phospholipid transport system transporter-binding protein
VQLPATLTIPQAAAAHQQALAAIAQAPSAAAFVIDASALQEFDTAALAVLLAAGRAARARGLGFSIAQAPAKLTQLAVLYGVGELLGLKSA